MGSGEKVISKRRLPKGKESKKKKSRTQAEPFFKARGGGWFPGKEEGVGEPTKTEGLQLLDKKKKTKEKRDH